MQQKLSIIIVTILMTQSQGKKIRRYRKWSVTDAAKVEHYYSNDINDTDNGQGKK